MTSKVLIKSVFDAAIKVTVLEFNAELMRHTPMREQLLMNRNDEQEFEMTNTGAIMIEEVVKVVEEVEVVKDPQNLGEAADPRAVLGNIQSTQS